jgi:hypothetical protein
MRESQIEFFVEIKVLLLARSGLNLNPPFFGSIGVLNQEVIADEIMISFGSPFYFLGLSTKTFMCLR